jgi:hypothetical protein
MLYVYHGQRSKDGCVISVSNENSNFEDLPLRTDLFNHSSRFEWGYHGSGPAQTALAILVHHLKNPDNHPTVLYALRLTESPPPHQWMGVTLHESLVIRYYQLFKSRIVSRLPLDGWVLKTEDINKLIIAFEDMRVVKELANKISF